MAICGGPAVAGNVLQDRQDAALFQPLRDGAGDRRDLARFGSIGPVTDHRVGPGHRDVRQRQAIHRNPEVDQIGRDQPRTQPGSL